MQGTGGSSAMANSWMQLRHAGATARAMLVTAAATEWNVTPASLMVERGVVHHAPSNRQATFGELAGKASSLPVPNDAPLKDPEDFKLIGQKLPRVDIPGKTNGTAQFTIDVTFPNMLVAVLQRPPLFGATVKSFDPSAAKAVRFASSHSRPGRLSNRGSRSGEQRDQTHKDEPYDMHSILISTASWTGKQAQCRASGRKYRLQKAV